MFQPRGCGTADSPDPARQAVMGSFTRSRRTSFAEWTVAGFDQGLKVCLQQNMEDYLGLSVLSSESRDSDVRPSESHDNINTL